MSDLYHTNISQNDFYDFIISESPEHLECYSFLEILKAHRDERKIILQDDNVIITEPFLSELYQNYLSKQHTKNL